MNWGSRLQCFRPGRRTMVPCWRPGPFRVARPEMGASLGARHWPRRRRGDGAELTAATEEKRRTRTRTRRRRGPGRIEGGRIAGAASCGRFGPCWRRGSYFGAAAQGGRPSGRSAAPGRYHWAGGCHRAAGVTVRVRATCATRLSPGGGGEGGRGQPARVSVLAVQGGVTRVAWRRRP